MEQQRAVADRWGLVAMVVTAFATAALIDQLTGAPFWLRLVGSVAAGLLASYAVRQWVGRRAAAQGARP